MAAKHDANTNGLEICRDGGLCMVRR
jgi:hypothetical protein